MKNLIGKYLSATVEGHHFSGEVVFFLGGGKTFTDDELKEFADLEPGDRDYKSVRGPAKVDRVVLRKDNGHFLIAPTHLFL